MTKSILFISPFLEKKTYGGSQLSKYMFSRLRSRIPTRALSLNNCTSGDPEIPDNCIDYIGAPKSRFSTLFTNLCLLTGRLSCKSILKIVKKLMRQKADIIILDSSRLGILAIIIRLLRKDLEIITIYHNCERVILSDQIKKNFLYSLSAPAVLLSEYLAKKFSDKHILLTEKDRLDLGIVENYEIVTPMLSKKFIYNNRPGVKVVGFLGSNYKPNNEAADYINEVLAVKFPNLQFLIAGSCKLSSSTSKNVNYCGFVDNIETFFKEIDVFLSPVMTGSGINIKIIDALSFGMPVVCSDLCASGFEKFKDKGITNFSDMEHLGEVMKTRQFDAVAEEVLMHYMTNEKNMLDRICSNA